jgi:hypothetical protein
VLLEHVETFESYRTQPLHVVVHRFLDAQEGGSVAVVSVDVGHVPAEVPPSVIARFRPLDATGRQRLLGEDSFRVQALDGRRIAQGRLVLPPGDYDITVLVASVGSAETGMYRDTFRILSASDALSTSDFVWADELSPVRYAALASYDEPFVIGPFRVVPALDATFERGRTVNLFYEVYGGDPPYRIQYQIEGRELDGSWRPLGQPTVGEQAERAQGWGVPTTPAWPAGEYRVRIDVEDAARRLFSAQVPFTLVVGTAE